MANLQQEFLQQMAKAEALLEQGASLFAVDTKKAMRCYHQANLQLKGCEAQQQSLKLVDPQNAALPPDVQVQFNTLRVRAKSNLTACLEKEKKWQRVFDVSAEVLAIQPDHIKSLRRRCKAGIKIKQFDEAKQCALRGLEIAPEDVEIQRLYSHLLEVDAFYDRKQRREMQGWLEKM
eukprot:m.8806 g.8806  ORF g.8806 m.8806 type:complete len:177 (-) comp5398_c0_seq2:156-686(-)